MQFTGENKISKKLNYSCVVVLLLTLSAYAQLQPPAGWTSVNGGNAVVMTSPSDASGHIALTLLPPTSLIGEIKSWFAKQTLALAQVAGRPTGSTNVMDQNGVLFRGIEIENQNHAKLKEIFYGYPVEHGLGMVVLTIPSTVTDQDSRVTTANQYVRQLAAQKFALAASPATTAPAASPGNQKQYVGEYGRSDIDLTYHAKAVIPKERDIALKGVYVFVGFAYGATYGGVGTTMNWGQHEVQQLLLLYDNGVAAKTDLRGGNLAGKYQAEGFATLDVADANAVSGAPFGHWSDDGNIIHIRWNIGAPTDLAKNGNNLEGKGERWTPFQLAEADRLEGIFVRKMEAGLRSQSIVLRKDGTFVGDGVNVTMGGSIVSPQFPERGSGTYEVHKGSMILYFSNGFTQAVACIIDKTNNGEAKTVLLNGFPFERVR